MTNKKENKDTNNGHFDLSGVFHVQNKYLTDLSNSYPNVNNAPLVASYVLDLQNKVEDSSKSYKKANTSASNVLTEQNKMIEIVNDEQKRLEKKKFLIDGAESEERRKALLTESNRLRKTSYTKIILSLIFCIVIHIILFLCVRHFFEPPIEPGTNTIFVLLHIFNFAVWTLIAFYIYIDIQSRSHINFNKLDLPPPKLLDTGISPGTADYSNLFKDLGLCYSDGCCGENTVWDKKTGRCTRPVTTASSIEEKEGFENNSLNISPLFNIGKTNEQLRVDDELSKRSVKKEEKSIDATGFDQSTYDPKTASIEDVRKNTKLDVQKKMKSILGPTMDKMKGLSASIDEVNLDPGKAIDTSGLNDLGNSMLDDSVEKNEPGKCYFTTMEDAHEVSGSKKTNRMVYYPAKSNELLPTNNFLDNEVYYKGLNHSKELTDRFSNYK